MNICIVGFGNIAHGLVAITGDKHNVSILTSKEINAKDIIAKTKNGTLKGKIKKLSILPGDLIPQSDVIVFTVPAYAREKIIKEISLFIHKNHIIGSFPGTSGFDEQIRKYIKEDITIFSTQRVPFIARIVENGQSVDIDMKKSIDVAISKNSTKLVALLEDLLNIEVHLLDSFLEVNLSNSNPILHTARLYELLRSNQFFDKEILFYKEWTDEASTILLKMDEEFMKIVKKLNLKNIKSLPIHYEVSSAKEMTKKLQSIESFSKIKAPLKRLENGKYRLDFDSRYFTEDVLFGLKYIFEYAKKIKIDIPTIAEVYLFLKSEIKK